MSFMLKYPGACPDPAEPLAGTSLPAWAPPSFPATSRVSERDGKALDIGQRRDFAAACHLLSFRQQVCDHRGSPLWGLPIPGDTAWPGSLQTRAHVGSDRQELCPVLVTLVGFLLSAPSGKQTVILYKYQRCLELWWRRENSIHMWSIHPFAHCPMAAVTGGGCILA